ncbi:glycosyltransferase family 2 protein [Lentibacillus amyloliquefaciens]|uniref:Glycosyl transferase family 2 n=1 Tax=Lentibacillus amyloliquefaciens TaxID=1472767 RepID=A0A0U4E8U7_9BACI|nr:glycosyltransferase family A protein [Lentibacillus amyloliquefaciens]ALX49249.1 glycosyl transferase family 2 [Lentibacillus amyloliquefaciens]
MRDITAILIHYSVQTALSKALVSLKSVSSRLNAVIVFQQRASAFKQVPDVDWSDRIRFVSIEKQDEGEVLQETINTIDTTYVLLLSGTDYLSAVLTSPSLQLAGNHSVLGTFVYNRGISTRQPLLVRTLFLRQHPFMLSYELPFKEALFSAWLATVKSPHKNFQENLVKQTRKNNSKNVIERQKIIQKYHLEKTTSDYPSLSIIMSAYNMEAYVQTAAASCLLQNEQAEQLLIMDDGSMDNTQQRLQCYRGHSRVKMFSKENGGKARALNALLPHVTSDFILELDADDWLDPDAVSTIKKHLAGLPEDVSVLYGNLRKWKQLQDDVMFKGHANGTVVRGKKELLSYRFPLGPRIYRTSLLKKEGGFPVIDFADGRLYEDVSVLNRLLKKGRFQYSDFTVYNVREHKKSITKQNLASWNGFLKTLE